MKNLLSLLLPLVCFAASCEKSDTDPIKPYKKSLKGQGYQYVITDPAFNSKQYYQIEFRTKNIASYKQISVRANGDTASTGVLGWFEYTAYSDSDRIELQRYDIPKGFEVWELSQVDNKLYSLNRQPPFAPSDVIYTRYK